MKIITVNLKVTTIERCKEFVGNASMYPSRSELFRVALKNFILRELPIFIPPEEEELEDIDTEEELRVLCYKALDDYQGRNGSQRNHLMEERK